MPSRQFLEFMQKSLNNPLGGDMPGPRQSSSGEWIAPTMPEDFEMVIPPVPTGIQAEIVFINGIKGIRVSVPGVKKGKVFFHIHGGGYTIGSVAFAVPFLVHIVKKLKIECYSIEYSLAPKHKFPTQINEIVQFYKGLLAMGFEKRVMGGESVGGTLSIAVTHYLKDNKLPLPVAVVALSARADMSVNQGYYKKDFLSERSSRKPEAYAGNADLKNPYLSPIYGDFRGFPPLMLRQAAPRV